MAERSGAVTKLASITREAVLSAIDEFDRRGRDEFLREYEFGPSREYALVHNDQTYDSKAILGAAYRYAHPGEPPLRSDEFSGGLQTTVRVLSDLGFTVEAGGTTQPNGRAWIFQANPKYFDLRRALAERDELNWLVSQYRRQINIGDRVYLWESGPSGGILARATVLSEPVEAKSDAEEFMVDPARLAGAKPRVKLRIEDVLSAPIGRETIASHPGLQDLQILKFANATNFVVTPDEQVALDALIGDGASPSGGGGLQAALEEILAGYGAARSEPFGSDSSAWSAFERLNTAVAAAKPVQRRATVTPTWSAGKGNWARVPWLALLDSRETTTTQSGVYPVFLFRQDMSGVYLTLAQGVTEPKKQGRAGATAYLQAVAQRVREQSPDLAGAGFSLDGEIDLRSDPGLGRDYELSTIAHKLYDREALPPDRDIEADLDAVLDAYDRYIDGAATSANGLETLAAAFREQRPYPTDSDKTHVAAREELAAALSKDNLEAVEADPATYDMLLPGRFAGGAYGNPGPQSALHRGVIDGGDEAKARLARALRFLLYDGNGTDADRIDAVLTDPDLRVFGFAEHLAVKALALVFPERWLPIFGYGGDQGKKRLAQSVALRLEPLDESRFDTPGKRATEANVRLREVLEPLFPDDPWAQGQFLYWLRDQEAVERPPQVGTQALAEELLLDRAWLDDTIDLLRDKRQVIFYGPPGTGKTFVARKLAAHVAQDSERVRVVQFHPSYAYEDFVQGFRPISTSTGGSVQFELRPGPLRQIAEAASESEADWCLLIDEINRGNIAKVFGELYYLLEYRDDEIELQYGERFRLPTNLYIIATMNTADRSIALLDAALRRRFHFIPFFPDRPPIQGLLRRWLEQKKPGMEYVADLVDRANALLPDRHLQIGPSHFMTPRLNDQWLEKIWRGSVLPYIEEQFFDEPERVEAFRLERLGNPAATTEEEDDAVRASTDPTP